MLHAWPAKSQLSPSQGSSLLLSPFGFFPGPSLLTVFPRLSSREDVQRPEPVPRLSLGPRQLRLGGVGPDGAGELQRSFKGASSPPPRPGGGSLRLTSRPSWPGISLLQTISYFIAKESCDKPGLMTWEEKNSHYRQICPRVVFFLRLIFLFDIFSTPKTSSIAENDMWCRVLAIKARCWHGNRSFLNQRHHTKTLSVYNNH